jgi:hypothetical protein
MEPKLKQCRACGEVSEKMAKCTICKERFQKKWSELLLLHVCVDLFIYSVIDLRDYMLNDRAFSV